jgi:hypothetical protein
LVQLLPRYIAFFGHGHQIRGSGIRTALLHSEFGGNVAQHIRRGVQFLGSGFESGFALFGFVLGFALGFFGGGLGLLSGGQVRTQIVDLGFDIARKKDRGGADKDGEDETYL